MGGAPLIDEADELIVRVEELADRHRYAEAIAVIERSGLVETSPALCRELVALRRRGFEALDRRVAPVDPPPQFDDPFPEVSGRLPEVAADDLTPALVGGAVHHHGALIVRGVVPGDRVPSMVEAIDHTFDAYDAYDPFRPGSADDPARAWYSRLDDPEADQVMRAWVRQGGGVWAAESPVGLARIMAVFRERQLDAIVRAYFDEVATLSVNKLTFRRVTPDGGHGGWHQDGSFMGDGVLALNLWITLTDCGGDADEVPGLRVVSRRVDELLPTEAPFMPNAVDPDLVAQRFGDDLSVPAFAAGDGLLFDEHFLHATYRVEGMTRERYTIETWYFPPSRFPPDYLGILA